MNELQIMVQSMDIEKILQGAGSNKFFNDHLKSFDLATCEALAVSQAIGIQMAEPHIGYATNIFTRLCTHSISLMRAVPRSRWVRADFDDWDFGCAAGHCRSIIEGTLLFQYLIETPSSRLEWSAKLNVMHLNDCARRIKLMSNVDAHDDVAGLSVKAEELRGRLRLNEWFLKLEGATQKRCLAGDNVMIPARDEMLVKAGWEKKSFYVIWDILSQYAHVLPISFYRMEPGGRGTGIENDADKCYLALALQLSADAMTAATDLLVEAFPDTGKVRKGIQSKFSPGPRSNRPTDNLKGKRKNAK